MHDNVIERYGIAFKPALVEIEGRKGSIKLCVQNLDI
jgi:hypothetical protein